VDAAYLKNYGSWDVQGIYPDSTTQEGSYYYGSAAHVIRHHNWRTQRLTTLAATLGEAGIKFLIESRELQYKMPAIKLPDKRPVSVSQSKAHHVL